MRLPVATLLIAVQAAWAGTAFAHHGIVNFDLNKEIDVAGVVTELRFVNPHSWLYFDVTGEDGPHSYA